MVTDDAERQGLIAALARWNIAGRLTGILPLLSKDQLRDLLMTFDEVNTLGYHTAQQDQRRGVE